ncbi:MAG: hypothetical protein IJ742_01075 [Prevotella sp.]|nr:hypothetical protein [Prevotella sp.]
MKKKIFNGILLVAALFATSSAFVSCKDNDADEITNARIEIQKNLNAQIADLKAQLDAVKASIPAAYNDTELRNKITELENKINNIKPYDDTAIKADITAIKADIETIKTDILALQNSIKGIVTGVNAVGSFNPIYGTFMVPGVQPIVLAAYYNEVGKDIDFHGVQVEAGSKIVSANAGTIYVSLNPTTVSTEGKTLSLVNTQDGAAAIKLGALKASDKVLTFGWTRADNGFYEAEATLDAADIEKAKLNIDFENLKSNVKTALQKRTMSSVKALASNIVAEASEITPAYAVKVAWEDKILSKTSVISDYEIAAFAIKALSFDFKVSSVAPENFPGIDQIEKEIDKILSKLNINVPTGSIDLVVIDDATILIPAQKVGGVNIPAQTVGTSDAIKQIIATLNGDLTKVNEIIASVQKLSTLGTDLKSDVSGYLEKLNNGYKKLIEYADKSFAPTLLLASDTKISRARGTFKAGKYQLLPTSYSAEIFAPAYKKWIEINGKGQLYEGSVKSIDLEVKAGETYNIVFEAVDFYGNVVKNEYTIKGE